MSTLQSNLQFSNTQVYFRRRSLRVTVTDIERAEQYSINGKERERETSNSGTKLWEKAMFFKSLSQGPILGLGSAAHPGFPPCGGTSPSFKWGTPACTIHLGQVGNSAVSVWSMNSRVKKKNPDGGLVRIVEREYQWGERWGQGGLKRRCVCWGRWSHGQTRRWAVPNGGPSCPRSLWNCHVAIASLLHWWSS